MRVAALYDIHGNLPALDSVLAEVAAIGVDQVVVGGDVTPGPMPAQVVDRLLSMELPVAAIRGNCELETLAILHGGMPDRIPESELPAFRWCAESFDGRHVEWMRSWPRTLTVTVYGIGDVLFCHATPRDENEIFTVRTEEVRLREAFEGVSVPVVVCGHTHMQFDRTVFGTRVINAGSVGSPFGRPGADWLLLTERGPELKHTDYDLEAAADAVRASSYPKAVEFAERSIMNIPSAAEMEELFTRAGL